MSTNGYEEAARERKAGAIANVLEAQGATAAQADRLDAEGRRAAEQLAVVNKASETTWARVVEILADHEAHSAWLRSGQVPLETIDAGDPFDLVPVREWSA